MTTSTEKQIQLIDNLLPQTQCGKCGFDGCRPYAKAIVEGEPINQCPPGGPSTITQLSQLLNQPILPLNPVHGKHGPQLLAKIREDECIGCTKCIQACPLDAIIGAAKLMHTVIENQCSGCDLCVEPCPVDCIDMIPASLSAQPDVWRTRHDFHQQRLAAENLHPADKPDPTSKERLTATNSRDGASFSRAAAQQDIAAAVARVQARTEARAKARLAAPAKPDDN